MRVVTLDFETYFDNDYTLSKMTTEEYVRDARFSAHGAAVHEPPEPPVWLLPRELKETLEAWRSPGQPPVAMICHHAQFDGLILSHHYDYRPDFWIDTLSMGRVVFDGTVRLKLESLASKFNLQPKSVPYDAMRGLHWDNMSPGLRQRVAEGGMHDCVLTRQVADYMMGAVKHPAVPYPFPQSELQVVDLTIRMFTEPMLMGDLDLLGEAWRAEDAARQDVFARASELAGYPVTPEMLRQDSVFAELLELYDIEPEEKITNAGNTKYAFAKSDFFMQDLVASEDEDVAVLAEARLKATSSIYMTRVERYGWGARRGPLPVYLAYAAAHTRRWGGGDKWNWQNLPSCRNVNDPVQYRKGALRRAIKAP